MASIPPWDTMTTTVAAAATPAVVDSVDSVAIQTASGSDM
jgi:hypothetical protein